MSADPLLLPDGETSFHALRTLKKIYVDKSDLVADIAFNLGFTKRPIFLSRPRRFGKSLLVSTFASVFKSQAEDFQGLKLEAIYAALPKPQQNAIQSCKTITLDFSTMDTESVAAFRRSFRSKLTFALSKADPAFTNDGSATSAGDLLDIYLSGCSDHSIVLLIDEYDAPLTAFMHSGNPRSFKQVLSALNGFYRTVKARQSKFLFSFVTGVVKFSHAGLFSGQ